jgi:hypothetical protein
MKWLIDLLAPQKYKDMLIAAQNAINGFKTYLGIAIMITNQIIAPILGALAGLADQFTALQGLGAVLVFIQDIAANPNILKIGEAITLIGVAHKGNKIVDALKPVATADPFDKPLCGTILPDGQPIAAPTTIVEK